jgi:polar amino acid transport system substrate-binding protein
VDDGFNASNNTFRREPAMPNRRHFAGAFGAAVFVTATAAHADTTPATESTFDRVRRTKALRIAALPGEQPFFKKDLASGEWSGIAIDMAKDIANVLGAKLQYVESTYGNSVLDLQANKVDLAFALQPTPQRALAIAFSAPYYLHPFAYVARPGITAQTWGDLNKPDIRVASLIGSLMDNLLPRYAPKAQYLGYKDGDGAILAVQSGRADVIVYGLIQALGVTAKNPMFEKAVLLRDPLIALPSCMGLQQEPDRRWKDFIDNWVLYNHGTGQIGVWFRKGMQDVGIKASAIPPDAGF